jgi:hypothetical protein
MANKNHSKDSKDSAAKRTLNPPAGGNNAPGGATNVPNPPGPAQDVAPSRRVGQFTGQGAPGLQKK